MKCHICTLFFLFLLASNCSIGQTYLPLLVENHVWQIQEQDGGNQILCYDIPIDSVVVDSGNTFYQIPVGYYYRPWFREDTIAKKIWQRDSIDSPIEYLLYDFSLVVGDTFHSAFGGFIPPEITVIQIDTIMTLAGPRKRWQFDNYFIPHYWIEGIGESQRFFYPAIGTDPSYTVNKMWKDNVLVYDQNLICSVPINCVTPSNLYESSIATNSALLHWTGVEETSSIFLSLRWREVGSTSWNPAGASLHYNELELSGLTQGTTYEWQMRKFCGADLGFTPFSPLNQFTTLIEVSTTSIITEKTQQIWYADGLIYFKNVLDVNTNLSVFSVDGKRIASDLSHEQRSSYRLPRCSPGVYLVVIQEADGRFYSNKIVKY